MGRARDRKARKARSRMRLECDNAGYPELTLRETERCVARARLHDMQATEDANERRAHHTHKEKHRV